MKRAVINYPDFLHVLLHQNMFPIQHFLGSSFSAVVPTETLLHAFHVFYQFQIELRTSFPNASILLFVSLTSLLNTYKLWFLLFFSCITSSSGIFHRRKSGFLSRTFGKRRQELMAEMENTEALMLSQMRGLQSAFSLSLSCNMDCLIYQSTLRTDTKAWKTSHCKCRELLLWPGSCGMWGSPRQMENIGKPCSLSLCIHSAPLFSANTEPTLLSRGAPTHPSPHKLTHSCCLPPGPQSALASPAKSRALGFKANIKSHLRACWQPLNQSSASMDREWKKLTPISLSDTAFIQLLPCPTCWQAGGRAIW